MHQLIIIVRMHTIYYYTSGGWAGFKCLPYVSLAKGFFPASPQRRECGTFPLLFFLEMIHISLKEGWFICRGHECHCKLFIYLFISSNIFTHGSVFRGYLYAYRMGHLKIRLYTRHKITILIHITIDKYPSTTLTIYKFPHQTTQTHTKFTLPMPQFSKPSSVTVIRVISLFGNQ